MSEENADDFELIEVELILERAGVILMKVPKGYNGPLPGVSCERATLFVHAPADQEFFGTVGVEWYVDSLKASVWGEPIRTGELVFDARPLIQKEGGIIPKTVSGSSEGEE